MTRIAVTIYFLIWIFHILVGGGAGYAIVSLYNYRRNPFILRLAIYLNAAVIDFLTAILLLFFVKGVKIGWTFITIFFITMFLEDCTRLPLILYIFKGPGKGLITATEDAVIVEAPKEETK